MRFGFRRPDHLFVGQAFLLATPIKSRPASGSACPTSPVPVSISRVGHPPRIPVLLRLDQSVIYFVTFCVEGRVLDNDDAFAAFRGAIARLDWHIIAAVVMPDHVHLLAGPRDRDAAVGSLSAAIKRAIRKRLNAAWQWQPGCFDRLLRLEESAEEKMGIHTGKSGARRLSFALV